MDQAAVYSPFGSPLVINMKEIMRILTGAGVVDTEIALVHAAGRGKLGIGEAPLQQKKRNTGGLYAYVNVFCT